RTTFTGQWFASGFLQTPPHDDALAIGCTLPTAGRVRDFHPLERAPAGRTQKRAPPRLRKVLFPIQNPSVLYHLSAYFSMAAAASSANRESTTG
ncbi:hypothetical protein, partial [Enterocloster clostridioformis]|uniref:hypothetical protein n=3 Tax=Enterocloster clostridioformis TaxID=1531 RepID=UPI001A9B5520